MNNEYLNIIKTLAWFDVFDYPLRERQIFEYLFKSKMNKEELSVGLKELKKKNKIGEKDGYYFLLSRDEIIEIRKEREKESFRKIRRTKLAAMFLARLPFVKSIMVCNSLGNMNAKKEDDIDLFIITKKNKIWLTRFLTTGFFKVFNLRPNKKTIKDKFCFSFYVTENNLNLQNLVKRNIDDPLSWWWLTNLILIYDEKDYFDKLLNENEWLKNVLPNFEDRCLRKRDQFKIDVGSIFKKFLEKVIGGEKQVKKIQLKIMPEKLKKEIGENGGVIVNDKILKLYLKDRREKYRQEWQKRINKYL
jgi:hypothetical protein